ncbi:MAG: DUF2892 domain-containing protein [Candidatus Methylacidiphilales bacterium]|nr:DUF2892 domain-containing protein [Candidatus Methylacidiphilales bacterium]
MSSIAMMFPKTVTRVEDATPSEINQRIERETTVKVLEVYNGGHEAIDWRLQELDREWDVERALETMAASVTLTSLTLGFLGNRKWLAMPFVVGGFLLQHALQGWCPPLEVLRRLGVRTAREIEWERTALRILRGDFERNTTDPLEALSLARQRPAVALAPPLVS